MNWDTVQQMIRIALYAAAGYFLGTGVADSEIVQAAISGAIGVGAFIWWLVFERNRIAKE